jgi:hypothetical protein
VARAKRTLEKAKPTFTQQSNTGAIGRRIIKIPRLFLDDKGVFYDEEGGIWLCLASLHLFDKKQQAQIGQEFLRRINGE